MSKSITEYAINCSRYVRHFSVKTGHTINKGEMVALDTTTGKAVTPSDATNLTVVGIAENNAGAGETVFVLSGCFAMDSDTTNAVTAAHINKKVYIKNATSVSSSEGTNSVVAGICRFIDSQDGKISLEIGNYFV